MLGTSFGNVELLEGAKELYMSSGITKIQEFYGITFEDLFDKDKMKAKGISKEDLEYVLANREVEFARKSKEAWEMKRGLFQSKRWLKLKDFYGINERDIRNVEHMKKLGVKQEDIDFIIGKPDKPEEIKKEEDKKVIKKENPVLDELKQEAIGLGIKFNPNIGEIKLQEKINLVKNG